LTHEGGGDTQGLASTVKYTLDKYKGDASKVFVTGSSSGGMMTNVMVTTYTELFNAGANFWGVAAGCFAGDKDSVHGVEWDLRKWQNHKNAGAVGFHRQSYASELYGASAAHGYLAWHG
jgi:poly(3-hydroxybutyrate) depolymerase